MKIDQFIKEFNSANDKKEYVRHHITNRYVSFELKQTLAKNILDVCMYKEIDIGNGDKKRVLSVNSPARYFLYIITVVEQYTDIEFDAVPETPDSNDRLKAFNELEKSGATPLIVEAIGADCKAFSTVLKMMSDDVLQKEESLVSYLDEKMDLLRIAMKTFEDAVKPMLESATG